MWTHAWRVGCLEGEGRPPKSRWVRQHLAPGQGTASYHHRPPPPAPGMRTYPCDNLTGWGSTVGRWLQGPLRSDLCTFQHRAPPRSSAGCGHSVLQGWALGGQGRGLAGSPSGGRREAEADSGPDSAQLPLGM